MTIHTLDDKRNLADRLKKIVEADDIVMSWVRKDGTIGTLCTSGVADTTLMLKVLEMVYVDTVLYESSLEPVE